jgi:hypothetical protein
MTKNKLARSLYNKKYYKEHKKINIVNSLKDYYNNIDDDEERYPTLLEELK